MSSFRDQMGEDWLRYQHHLDGSSDSNQPLQNGLNAAQCPSTSNGRQPSPSSLEVPETLPPPLLSSEPKLETSDADADLETESTLQWAGHGSRLTEYTLEESVVDGTGQGVASIGGPCPEGLKSARRGSRDTKEEEEEEEDLGGRGVRHLLES